MSGDEALERGQVVDLRFDDLDDHALGRDAVLLGHADERGGFGGRAAQARAIDVDEEDEVGIQAGDGGETRQGGLPAESVEQERLLVTIGGVEEEGRRDGPPAHGIGGAHQRLEADDLLPADRDDGLVVAEHAASSQHGMDVHFRVDDTRMLGGRNQRIGRQSGEVD
jgi:hypothetical protein